MVFYCVNMVVFILQLKETGLSGEIVDGRAGAGNIYDEPGVCCSVRKQRTKTCEHTKGA